MYALCMHVWYVRVGHLTWMPAPIYVLTMVLTIGSDFSNIRNDLDSNLGLNLLQSPQWDLGTNLSKLVQQNVSKNPTPAWFALEKNLLAPLLDQRSQQQLDFWQQEKELATSNSSSNTTIIKEQLGWRD